MPIPNQSLIQAMVTEQTCGDACWHAREDICRCSCGGRNHGCLRTEDGQQPSRTRKIKGAMYQLVAVESYESDNKNTTESRIFNLERNIENEGINLKLWTYGDINWAEGYRMEHLPTFVKTASEDEVKRWPELSQWKEVVDKSFWYRPITLWLRIDFVDKFKIE
jgi:hypothetical protein